jgi:hypothetical protein
MGQNNGPFLSPALTYPEAAPLAMKYFIIAGNYWYGDEMGRGTGGSGGESVQRIIAGAGRPGLFPVR